MEIHDRIKSRRLQLGLTLEDVARKMNISAATLSRYESREIDNMGLNKLAPLAKALETTPAYLMGWESDITELTSEERNLIYCHKDLNELFSENPALKDFCHTMALLSNEGLKSVFNYAKYVLSIERSEGHDKTQE